MRLFAGLCTLYKEETLRELDTYPGFIIEYNKIIDDGIDRRQGNKTE